MSSNYDLDDSARLQALEHMVRSIALMWSVNSAQLKHTKPSIEVAQLADAIRGTVYDSKDSPTEQKRLMDLHLKRLLTELSDMAKFADQIFK